MGEGMMDELPADLVQKLRAFKSPENLGFGAVMAPVMAMATYEDGCWSDIELKAFGDLSLSPATKAFHYGQQIFEGMKAHFFQGNGPFLYRPEDYGRRFMRSAERMAMPELPLPLFLESVSKVVAHQTSLMPKGEGEALYLRPLMFATDQGLHLKRSDTYIYVVMASPSATYFSGGRVAALIDREDCRAAPGGTGACKAAGNYGGSIRSGIKAADLGFQQTLWLDGVGKKYVEEFSGMNFYALIDGKLYTPELNSCILGGITRDSVLTMARSRGLETIETKIDIDQLIEDIKSGRCTEVFACGTAAGIAPIQALGEKTGEIFELPYDHEDQLWLSLRQQLIGIQTGTGPDPWGWRVSARELAGLPDPVVVRPSEEIPESSQAHQSHQPIGGV